MILNIVFTITSFLILGGEEIFLETLFRIIMMISFESSSFDSKLNVISLEDSLSNDSSDWSNTSFYHIEELFL